MTWQPIDTSRTIMYYEDPCIYDGWSVAEYEDHSLHNRWPEDDPRHVPTAQYIKELESYFD